MEPTPKPTIEEQINKTIADAIKEVHKDQKETIEATIKTVVNGKIDKLQIHMGEQDLKLDDITREQVRVKEELKRITTDTNPLVDIRKTALNIGKFLMWICGIILGVAGALKIFQ